MSFYNIFFATPYLGIDFQYLFHQFASHFFSIELNFHSIVELNLVKFKLHLNCNWNTIELKFHSMYLKSI
jgi:hypothetical protein